jgi:hypothetical protein
MGLSLRIRIVLIAIDRAADVVLPLIDLLMFLRGQVAAVRRAISRNLTIDARLTTLDVPGLTRCHLAGTNPLGNALLLVLSSYSPPGESRILRTSPIHRSDHPDVQAAHARKNSPTPVSHQHHAAPA